MAFPFIAWTNKVNRKDKVDASHVNQLAKGINDLGTYTDVELARIDAVLGGSFGDGITIINSSTPTSLNGLLIGNGTSINQINVDYEATASTIVKRDENGRSQIANPIDDADIANKEYVDTSGYAGTVIYFASTTAPTGYLECNGAAISRTTYSALFTVIGTTFGVGDNSTTFNIPDLRGEFIRGYDNGRGVDTSRVFGSSQLATRFSIDDTGSRYVSDGEQTATATTDSGGSSGSFSKSAIRVRPRNVALLPCIKY